MAVPSWAESYINCINGGTRYNGKVSYSDIANWVKNPSISGQSISEELGGQTLYSSVTYTDFEYAYDSGAYRTGVCTGEGIVTIDIRTVSGGYAITDFNKPLRRIFYRQGNSPQYTAYSTLNLSSGWYDPANGMGEQNYTYKTFTNTFTTLQSLFNFLLSSIRYCDIYVDGENWSRVSPVPAIISNGGGATHIAKVTGQLSSLSNNLSDILMVSGGGGGGLIIGEDTYAGKEAGGISGSGDNSADQSTGYAFGQGESGANVSGGGSGLYGGYKGTSAKSGGAGSGYIGNSLLSNKKMVGYNVPTSDVESTKTESVNEASESPVSGKPKIGNGYARIKFLRES